MNPLSDVVSVLRLAILLRRLKIEASLAYFIKPVIFGNLAAFLARVPKRFRMTKGMGYVFSPPVGRQCVKLKVSHALVSRLYKWSLKRWDAMFLSNDGDNNKLVIRMSADHCKN